MNKKEKSSGAKWRPVLILALALVLLGILTLLRPWRIHVGGRSLDRDTVRVELAGASIRNISPLLKLEDPEYIDLRGCTLSPEDFEALYAAFPDCEIYWDVPVAGGRFDSSAETLVLTGFEMTDSENWRYLSSLNELDLRLVNISAADCEVLQAALPECNIRWSIKLEDGFTLSSDATDVSLSDAGQTELFLAASEDFDWVETIIVSYTNLSLEHYEALRAAFPEAELNYSIEVAGNIVDSDAEVLDLSSLGAADAEEVAELMKLLPNVSEVELVNGDGESQLTLDDVLKLQKQYPELKLQYSFEFFGMTISTDMERVEYFGADIGDSGLDEFRKILPLMHSLSYLRLDDCGTTDEAMAKFRDENPEIKIVWRVFLGGFSCPTDTLKVWATYSLTNQTAAPLKYCTEVKYMDLGHNEHLSDFSFLQYMPDLEVAILAITAMDDLEPIRNCKKLNFLEIFSTDITDISPLADLENLEYLNISNMWIKDLSPLFGLEKLKHVNCLLSKLPADQAALFQENFPDVHSVFLPGGDPTDYGWRYNNDGSKTERYALLTKQIGYDTNDMSVYPRGYVTEEITMD